jgi:hypothetical protein
MKCLELDVVLRLMSPSSNILGKQFVSLSCFEANVVCHGFYAEHLLSEIWFSALFIS